MRYQENVSQNGHLNTNLDQPLKYIERITPPRNGPSFLRIVLMPTLISVALLSLAVYATSGNWVPALGWGAGLSFPFAFWRVIVWDNQPTDAIDIREYQDIPAPTAEPRTLIQPEVTGGPGGRNQIRYGRFTFSEQAWRKWSAVMSDNEWKITRDILSEVRINDRCIFTNLTANFNDIVGEMHRIGWTIEDKSKLSDAGVAWFVRWLDPPTPA